jgi:hypothetical protein
LAEPDNTPRSTNLKDNMSNPHANIVVPSKQMERFSEKYNEINTEAENNNKQLNDETERLKHKNVFVFCNLCSGKLNRKHGKDKEVDIGYGIVLNVQKWSCSVCRMGYVGYLPNVYCEDNRELKAEIMEYPQ